MRGVRGADLAGVATLILAAVIVGALLMRGGTWPLDRSAVGLNGLISWMRGQGAEIRYAGQQPAIIGEIGLRLLPILDTDPSRPFERPVDDRDYLMSGTERDLSRFLIQRKTELLPTLVIAPKWRRAMRHTGYAHASFLLPEPQAAAGIAGLDLHRGALLRPGGLLEIPYPAGARTGLLYEPQLFPKALGPGCRPVLSAGPGHLLIRCQRETGPVWALSDPDLMNNHGLSLAGNAAIAATVLTDIAGNRPILVDTSDRIIARETPPPLAARDWADLARLWAWPYWLVWAGLGALTVLLLWHAWVRFGPARSLYDDRLSAARGVSIAAKAGILRMAGSDGQLLRAHVAQRLRRIERDLLGRNGGGDPTASIVATLQRRDPGSAAGFSRVARAAMRVNDSATPAQVQSLIEDFEREAERAVHGS